MWAIAINAVREAKIASGRADDPFSDDDSARVTSIYQLLHVHENMSLESEHFPLAGKVKVSDQATRVAKSLWSGSYAADETADHVFEFSAMGTQCRLRLCASSAQTASQAAERAIAEVRRLELKSYICVPLLLRGKAVTSIFIVLLQKVRCAGCRWALTRRTTS